MKESILGTEKIGVLFWRYSIPGVAAMLFLALNTIVDGFFVGNYVGISGLASVNIAMPFTSLMLAVCVMAGLGAQSMIGRALGGGNSQQAKDVFKTSLLLVGLAAAGFAMAAAIFPQFIARVLGANEAIIEQTALYIRYVGIFLPCLALMMVLDYVLKTIGLPIYAMGVLVTAVCCHMFFNWLLIAQLSMGIKGAALATGIAYTTAFVLALLPILQKQNRQRFFGGAFNLRLGGHILYTGSSEGLNEAGTGVTTFLFNFVLMRYVGDSGVAAFTVISYLAFGCNNLLIGLADGIGAIVSYNYGSRQFARVKKIFKFGTVAAFSIGAVLFLGMVFYSRDVIALFLPAGNERVLEFAAYGAQLYAAAFLLNGFNIVASGYFTAIGQANHAVCIALSKGILGVGAGVLILPLLLGINGIWLAVPLAEGMAMALSVFLLRRHFICRLR